MDVLHIIAFMWSKGYYIILNHLSRGREQNWYENQKKRLGTLAHSVTLMGKRLENIAINSNLVHTNQIYIPLTKSHTYMYTF